MVTHFWPNEALYLLGGGRRGGFPNKEKSAGVGHVKIVWFTIPASFLSDRAKDMQERP